MLVSGHEDWNFSQRGFCENDAIVDFARRQMPGPDQTIRKSSADGLRHGLEVSFEFKQFDTPLGQAPESFGSQTLLRMIVIAWMSQISSAAVGGRSKE